MLHEELTKQSHGLPKPFQVLVRPRRPLVLLEKALQKAWMQHGLYRLRVPMLVAV